MSIAKLLAFPLFGVVVAACAGAADPTVPDGVQTDEVEIVSGVPDHGRDPAVVALDVGDVGLCTASLIAPDVALTARHCVSQTSEQVDCPAQGPQITGNRKPSSLRILVGDDVASAKEVAQGREVLVPPSDALCDADIALIVLDRPVDGISPLDVSKTGIAQGGHVTAVGYGRRADGDAAGIKLLREHVAVVETHPMEFDVGEATCQGDSGGPAIDESSGEIVGVVSRGGPTCDGKGVHNIYTRVDAFRALVDAALAKSHAKTPPKKLPTPATDLGAACTKGSDCASGVCVKESGKQYCSRPCGSGDRCPTHFRCTGSQSGKSVCIEH